LQKTLPTPADCLKKTEASGIYISKDDYEKEIADLSE
jgi:hypothetical protein